MQLSIRLSFLFLTCVLLLLVITDMNGTNVKKNETNTLANIASYQSVLSSKDENMTEEKMIQEAVKQIVYNKESDSDIKIQVLGIDAENGMIDLNVIQTIHHANGQTSTTEERRTVILDDPYFFESGSTH